MFLIIAQFFSFLLASIAVSKSYVDLRAKRESLSLFLFWTITWVGIVGIAFNPKVVDYLISSFGEGRSGLGTFFGMGLVFLYFIVYRIYTKLDRIERKLTKVVQEVALRDDVAARGKF